jgi:3D (Asp-Asp-Asp) domain-containing protein
MTPRKVGLLCLALVSMLLSANLAAAPEATRTARDIALSPDPLRFHTTVTAYSSSPDETWGDPFITASGRRVFDGLVACPRKLPFGTRVQIGHRQYDCYDRLHPKYDDRFDIWMPSKHAALEFGARKLQVVVVSLASPHRPRAKAQPRGRAQDVRHERSHRDASPIPVTLSAMNRADRTDQPAPVHVDPLRVSAECAAPRSDDLPRPGHAGRGEPLSAAEAFAGATAAIVDRRAIARATADA